MLSPPTSHLLNEPSIDRRHFVVSRFPSHLATAPALPPSTILQGEETGESLLPEVLPPFDRPHLLATDNRLKSFRDLFSGRREPARVLIVTDVDLDTRESYASYTFPYQPDMKQYENQTLFLILELLNFNYYRWLKLIGIMPII